MNQNKKQKTSQNNSTMAKMRCIDYVQIISITILFGIAVFAAVGIVHQAHLYSEGKRIFVISEKEYEKLNKDEQAAVVDNYDKLNSIVEKLNDKQQLELSIADMQATTLSISALSVTLLTIIISLLSYFREKKLELAKEEIEHLNDTQQSIEETTQLLASIQVIQTMELEQNEVYFDSLNNYLKQDGTPSNATLIRISLLNRLSEIAEMNDMHDRQMSYYKQIIVESKNALIKDDISRIEKQMIIFSALNAYYRHASELKRTDTVAAKEELDTALSFIKRTEGQYDDDTLGYIDHYKGLLYLWYVLCDDGNSDESGRIARAIEYLDRSIDKSKANGVFLNDRAVAYIRKYELWGNNNDLVKARDDLQKSIILAPLHGLTYLNIATTYEKELKRDFFGINELPFLPSLITKKISKNETVCQEALEIIDNQLKNLEMAKLYKPNFTNIYYKAAELLTFKLMIYQHLTKITSNDYSEEIEKTKNDIENHIANSNRINKDVLGCLFVERNYRELLNEDSVTRDINEIIRRKNPGNASKWDKLLEEAG